MDKDVNGCLKDAQMPNKHMQVCLVSSAIREIKVEVSSMRMARPMKVARLWTN
jgi:hypothetical protein